MIEFSPLTHPGRFAAERRSIALIAAATREDYPLLMGLLQDVNTGDVHDYLMTLMGVAGLAANLCCTAYPDPTEREQWLHDTVMEIAMHEGQETP